MRQRRRHFVRFIHYLVSKERAAAAVAAANNDNDVEQKKQREWLNSSRRNTD